MLREILALALASLTFFMLPRFRDTLLLQLRSSRIKNISSTGTTSTAMKGITAREDRIPWFSPTFTSNSTTSSMATTSVSLITSRNDGVHVGDSTKSLPANTALHHQPHEEVAAAQQQQKAAPLPPVLLLEGESLRVSSEGIARSFYQLRGSSLTVEERYHLEDATKSFILRQRGVGHSAVPLDSVQIQEIDTQAAGTGGTTWEASIAMSLYFAQHPEALQGNVVELGSGVGLGGILLSHVTDRNNHITLTDASNQVLAQCRENVQRLVNHSREFHSPHMCVKRMDWYEVLEEQKLGQKQTQQYNTVIACDCAYRIKDAEALSGSLKALLLPDKNDDYLPADCPKPHNKIHLFGPYNRVAFQETIQLLKDDKELEVKVDSIEMSRYRLQAKSAATVTDATSVIQHPYHSHDSMASEYIEEWKLEEELQHAASQSMPKFLHVTAFYRNDKIPAEQNIMNGSLSDID